MAIYRFRTIENLLGKHNELQNQEIYFASPEELNDPMEGYRDIFWKGDEIVWRNFIINYIKSANHAFSMATIMGDAQIIQENDLLVFCYMTNYKNNQFPYTQIQDKIFENSYINGLPKSLALRLAPIRRDELLQHLQIIHPFILNVISDVYHANRFIKKPLFNQDLSRFYKYLTSHSSMPDLVNKLEAERSKEINTERMFQLLALSGQQTNLIGRYNLSDKPYSENIVFLLSEFPEKYLSKCEKSIYPNWYSASFLADCTNSSIWGHYGDNHRGVCLKFKATEHDETPQINLYTEYGYNSSGPLRKMVPHKFKKVNYRGNHVEIDFFRSIARMNKTAINGYWYQNERGETSICGEHLNKNEEEWREKYWNNFFESLTVKLLEWGYEKEYRLIINGDLHNYEEKETRKLRYDFNELVGIIFGINTSIIDKIRIMKIIEDKCKKEKRHQFDFYQAYYSRETGKIESYKLNLLKFEQEAHKQAQNWSSFL